MWNTYVEYRVLPPVPRIGFFLFSAPSNYFRKNIPVTNGKGLSLGGMIYVQNTLFDYREKLKEGEN
jgi:hypothetical protein